MEKLRKTKIQDQRWTNRRSWLLLNQRGILRTTFISIYGFWPIFMEETK